MSPSQSTPDQTTHTVAHDQAPAKRSLKTWQIAAISVGFMGPVMAMSLNGIGVAGLVGKSVPFTFAVAFLGTLLVAYGFIRLTRFITHAGSVYALAGSTLGARAGFFGGFALLGTYIFFAGCIAGACSVFFEAMMAEFGVTLPAQAWLAVPVVVGIAALVLNLRESRITANALLAIGFVGIAAMIVLSIVIFASVPNTPDHSGIDLSVLTPGDSSLSAIMTASVFAFLSWAGFESGTALGEEADEPKRVVPRALLLAVVIGGVVYVFIMTAQSIGFGTDDAGIEAFATASSTLTVLSSTYIGSWFAIGISVIAFFVAFAAFLSSTAAASRLLFALARDGFGPAAFAKRNETTGVPTTTVIFSVVLAAVMPIVLGLTGATSVDAYYWYATIGTLCMVVAYAMTSVGVLVHTWRQGSTIPKYESIIPALGLAYLVFVFVIQVAGQEPPYSYFPWMAGAWCLIGLVIILVRPKLAERIGARFTDHDPLTDD